MRNYLYEFDLLFKNRDFDGFFNLFDSYVEKGFGFDYKLIFLYIKSLIKIKNYDSAYVIIKSLEKLIKYYDISDDIAFFYFYCCKYEDSLRIIFSQEHFLYSLLIRIYLCQGKIELASKTINDVLSMNITGHELDLVLESKRRVDNYYNKGAFIECDYSYFVSNGNSLEPGHVVFLNKNPQSFVCDVYRDEKNSNRPYMVWKIEKDKVYLFPISTSCRDNVYKLFQQNYPNSGCDRFVKNSLCFTSLENILFVKDKILDNDFKVILRSLFFSSYYSHGNSKNGNSKFLREYVGVPCKYDVIEFVDISTKEHSFYFVNDIFNEGYDVLKIDFESFDLISDEHILYKKSKFIFRIHKLSKENIDHLLSGVFKKRVVEDIVGKKCLFSGIKYIVLAFDDDSCLCVNDSCSLSYLMPVVFKKRNLDFIDEFASFEDLFKIKRVVSESINKFNYEHKRKHFKNR